MWTRLHLVIRPTSSFVQTGSVSCLIFSIVFLTNSWIFTWRCWEAKHLICFHASLISLTFHTSLSFSLSLTIHFGRHNNREKRYEMSETTAVVPTIGGWSPPRGLHPSITVRGWHIKEPGKWRLSSFPNDFVVAVIAIVAPRWPLGRSPLRFVVVKAVFVVGYTAPGRQHFDRVYKRFFGHYLINNKSAARGRAKMTRAPTNHHFGSFHISVTETSFPLARLRTRNKSHFVY